MTFLSTLIWLKSLYFSRMHWIESLVTCSNGCHLQLLPEVTWLLSIGQACHMSNSGYNTMSTIMIPLILSSIQHHQETSYNNSQYTTYIQRYASNHSILMTIEISRYISLYSAMDRSGAGHGWIKITSMLFYVFSHFLLCNKMWITLFSESIT